MTERQFLTLLIAVIVAAMAGYIVRGYTLPISPDRLHRVAEIEAREARRAEKEKQLEDWGNVIRRVDLGEGEDLRMLALPDEFLPGIKAAEEHCLIYRNRQAGVLRVSCSGFPPFTEGGSIPGEEDLRDYRR